MNTKSLTISAAIMLYSICTGYATAGVVSKAARETAEYALKKVGREASEEAVETLAVQIQRLGVKYGDDTYRAVKAVGPHSLQIIREAGEKAPHAIRLMSQFGDDAIWIVSKPRGLALFVRYGDDAARAMIRHRGVAQPMIEGLKRPAVKALNAINARNGRRLAMLADDGLVTAAGMSDQLLGVVSKYGDAAMEFIWKHKGALAASAAMVAFVRDPEPFINGTRDILSIATESAMRVPGKIAEGVAARTNWTVVVLVGIGLAVAVLFIRSRSKTVMGSLLARTDHNERFHEDNEHKGAAHS